MNSLGHKNIKVSVKAETGIVFAVFLGEMKVITPPVVKLCTVERIKASSGMSMPALFDIREVRLIESEAGRHFLTKEGIRFLNAGAFLVQNTVQKLSCSAFLSRYTKPVPFKIFTSKSAALRWLGFHKNLN